MMISTLGAGQFVNLGTSSLAVKFIAAISPIRYSVERIFRRLLSTTMYETPLLHFFGFTAGDKECLQTMAQMAVTFFVLGWVFIVYRSNRL